MVAQKSSGYLYFSVHADCYYVTLIAWPCSHLSVLIIAGHSSNEIRRDSHISHSQFVFRCLKSDLFIITYGFATRISCTSYWLKIITSIRHRWLNWSSKRKILVSWVRANHDLVPETKVLTLACVKHCPCLANHLGMLVRRSKLPRLFRIPRALTSDLLKYDRTRANRLNLGFVEHVDTVISKLRVRIAQPHVGSACNLNKLSTNHQLDPNQILL